MEEEIEKITSLQEYLQWVEQRHTEKNDETGVLFNINTLYYRGQADVGWKIKSSVFRAEYAPAMEHALILLASRSLWNELSIYRTYLEKLIFLQHHGLKTRLLDVTFNPLVALYFACKECKDKDGVVYCGHNCSDWIQDDHIAELTAEYLFLYNTEQPLFDLDKFLEEKSAKMKCFGKPIFIMPPMNNLRIEAQNGAFILPPLAKYNEGCKEWEINRNVPEKTFFTEKKAVIDHSAKEKILKQLDELGINQGSLFRSFTDKIQEINEKVKGQIKLDI